MRDIIIIFLLNSTEQIFTPWFAEQGVFDQNKIDSSVRMLFQKYDADKSGTFDMRETQRGVAEFCQMNGYPQPSESDVICTFYKFDFDRSGNLDFGEFKMLLEDLGKVKAYDQASIQQARNGRNDRVNKYQNNGCNLF